MIGRPPSSGYAGVPGVTLTVPPPAPVFSPMFSPRPTVVRGQTRVRPVVVTAYISLASQSDRGPDLSLSNAASALTSDIGRLTIQDAPGWMVRDVASIGLSRTANRIRLLRRKRRRTRYRQPTRSTNRPAAVNVMAWRPVFVSATVTSGKVRIIRATTRGRSRTKLANWMESATVPVIAPQRAIKMVTGSGLLGTERTRLLAGSQGGQAEPVPHRHFALNAPVASVAGFSSASRRAHVVLPAFDVPPSRYIRPNGVSL